MADRSNGTIRDAPSEARGGRRKPRTPVARLRGRRRLDAHAPAILAEPLVPDDPVDQREQREIAPHADVRSGMDARADLPDEDVPGAHLLAREDLHAAALSLAVTAVSAAALSLLVSHRATSTDDLEDAKRGRRLTVTAFSSLVLPALHLEDEDLLRLPLLDHTRRHLGSGDERRPDPHRSRGRGQQH